MVSFSGFRFCFGSFQGVVRLLFACWLLGGWLESVAAPIDRDNLGVMKQAVEYRRRRHIAEQFAPFFHGSVGSHHGRAVFVATHDSATPEIQGEIVHELSAIRVLPQLWCNRGSCDTLAGIDDRSVISRKPLLRFEHCERFAACGKIDHGCIMEVHGRDSAACPGCQSISRSRHSRYWRTLKVLPVQGTPVILGCVRVAGVAAGRRLRAAILHRTSLQGLRAICATD